MSNVLPTTLAVWADDMAGWGRMPALSIRSWKGNPEGPFEHVQLGGRYDEPQEMFRVQYAWLRELWHNGHNVLFADADTLAVRPVEMFGHFGEMRLFGLTHQLSHSRQDIPYGRYMNGAVMYMPQSMEPLLWELGDTLASHWPEGMWSYMQYIFNRMFWAQGEPEDWLHPELNFQEPCALVKDGDHSNAGLAWHEARIIHFHSSRGAADALATMRRVASWAVA